MVLFWNLQMAKPLYVKPEGPVYHSVFHGSHSCRTKPEPLETEQISGNDLKQPGHCLTKSAVYLDPLFVKKGFIARYAQL